MTNGVDRDLGAFEARLNNYETQLTEVRNDVKQLLAYANRTKGGWWALATVGTLGGAAGAAIAKMLATLKGAG